MREVYRGGQGGEREEGEIVGGAEVLGNRQRARVGGLMEWTRARAGGWEKGGGKVNMGRGEPIATLGNV
jgi:hypothetical protein